MISIGIRNSDHDAFAFFRWSLMMPTILVVSMRVACLIVFSCVLLTLDAFLQGFNPRFLAPKQHQKLLQTNSAPPVLMPRTLRKGSFWTNIFCSITVDDASDSGIATFAANLDTSAYHASSEDSAIADTSMENYVHIGSSEQLESENTNNSAIVDVEEDSSVDAVVQPTFEGPTVDGLPHGYGKLTSSAGHILEGEFLAGRILNGKGTFKDETGAIMEGEWVNGKLEGKAKIIFPNGSVHEGEYHDGALNGPGTQIHFSGNKYEGNFFNGMKHGAGVFTSADGNIYTGEFVDDVRHGQGSIQYSGGDLYVGEWKDNKREGQGRFTTTAGHVYEGTYVHGKLCGQAVVTYPRGDRYEGNLLDGKRHGQGKLTQASGTVYEGEYARGLQHGYGVLTYPTGARYEGQWKHSKKHGQGKLISPEGKVCEGEWKEDNIYNGKGYRVSAHNVSHEGTWIDGLLEGPGTVVKANSTIVGNFYRGDPHGLCKETILTGVVYEGTYKEGKKYGNFTITFPDGSVEQAEFKNSQLHGYGTHRYIDGTKYTGQWREGSRHGFGYKNYIKGGYYEGEWRAGLKEGVGKYVSPDNIAYEGEFRKDRLWNGRRYQLSALGGSSNSSYSSSLDGSNSSSSGLSSSAVAASSVTSEVVRNVESVVEDEKDNSDVVKVSSSVKDGDEVGVNGSADSEVDTRVDASFISAGIDTDGGPSTVTVEESQTAPSAHKTGVTDTVDTPISDSVHNTDIISVVDP